MYGSQMAGAMTGLIGNASSGGNNGPASAAAQIAAALMAKQRMQQWQAKNGITSYGNPAVQPGMPSGPGATPGMPANGQNPLGAGQQQLIPNAAQGAMPPSINT